MPKKVSVILNNNSSLEESFETRMWFWHDLTELTEILSKMGEKKFVNNCMSLQAPENCSGVTPDLTNLQPFKSELRKKPNNLRNPLEKKLNWNEEWLKGLYHPDDSFFEKDFDCNTENILNEKLIDVIHLDNSTCSIKKNIFELEVLKYKQNWKILFDLIKSFKRKSLNKKQTFVFSCNPLNILKMFFNFVKTKNLSFTNASCIKIKFIEVDNEEIKPVINVIYKGIEKDSGHFFSDKSKSCKDPPFEGCNIFLDEKVSFDDEVERIFLFPKKSYSYLLESNILLIFPGNSMHEEIIHGKKHKKIDSLLSPNGIKQLLDIQKLNIDLKNAIIITAPLFRNIFTLTIFILNQKNKGNQVNNELFKCCHLLFKKCLRISKRRVSEHGDYHFSLKKKGENVMEKIFDDINILLTLDDKNKIKLSQVGGKKRTKKRKYKSKRKKLTKKKHLKKN